MKLLFCLLLIPLIVSCQSANHKPMPASTYTNALIHESSPYLLQHAHNPVNWYPWGDTAWEKARKENKLVIISIGYSSCHWCHVMEHESFEDTAVARIMNDRFISIKVDREERPDVDQVYMTAVQLMTGSGGWPLNVVALPDGRPIYGGTYFPKNNWIQLLQQLADYYRDHPEEAKQYATQLTKGINQTEMIPVKQVHSTFTQDSLKESVAKWKKHFDGVEGGMKGAPKFPMPGNLEFLLQYGVLLHDPVIKDQVTLTLHKMAMGGIYDHIGGGFARYATDAHWKVPHFEKMLYDNAQLISVYSHAYQLSKDPLYKACVDETFAFLVRDMMHPDGGFYSALDADSEGKEGKYYVWTEDELKKILGADFPVFAAYFEVGKEGLWEGEENILLRTKSDTLLAKQFNLSMDDLHAHIDADKKLVLAARSRRIPPGLDDKQITSWNALMITACCDAYNAFGEKKFLDAAITGAKLNRSMMWHGMQHGYIHSITARSNSQAPSPGFLEDYAFSAQAFIALYQCTFDTLWLTYAQQATQYAMEHFFDANSGMFFFTADNAPSLIARKMELSDNVIPSSNSCMAHVLTTLAVYFDDEAYAANANQMLANLSPDLLRYPSSYSNWALLYLQQCTTQKEVVITGKNALDLRKSLALNYLPHCILAGCVNAAESDALGLLQDRFVAGKNLIYVCENKSCKLPVNSVNDALSLLESN